MRNEYTQTNEPPGEPVRHTALIDFIAHDYAHDDAGCWLSQDGPQRMLVGLDYTPRVAQLLADDAPRAFTTTTDTAFSPSGCFLDERSDVLLSDYAGRFGAEEAIAVLHDHDLEPFSSLANWHIEACRAALGTPTWNNQTFSTEPVARVEMIKHYDFVTRPAGQP